jgi:RNA polymerase sigma-70 factor (ECF subfamily)
MEVDETRSIEEAKLPMPQSVPSDQLMKANEVELAKEEECVRRVFEGDAQGFEQLYEKYVEAVYRYFYRRLENIAEAENLTSETFMRAVDAFFKGHYSWQGKPFGAWVFGIAARVLHEHYQHLKSLPVSEPLQDVPELEEPISEESDALTALIQEDERDALWRLVDELPEVERSVVILRHVYDLPYARIAERLGRSEDACKQMHYRALKKLKLKAQEADLWSAVRRSRSESKQGST